jgi:uncharacterized protein (DUF342 family)
MNGHYLSTDRLLHDGKACDDKRNEMPAGMTDDRDHILAHATDPPTEASVPEQEAAPMEIAGLRFTEGPPGQLVVVFDPAEDNTTQPPEAVDIATGATDSAAGPAPEITGQTIRAQAARAGFGDLAFDEAVLHATAQAIGKGVRYEHVVAQRINARCEVEVAPDAMTAWLLVIPAQGGEPADTAMAEAAVAAAYVFNGVDRAAIRRALANPSVRTAIALGQPAINGRDGWLEPLTEVNRSRHPHIDDKGHTDYRDLGAIPYVEPEERLMRLHAPETGTPGKNILGTELPPVPGKPIQYGPDLPNTSISPDDPDLLVAAAGGQPILKMDGILIEELIKFDEVTMATGNIDFPGSVEIKGDVHTGMRIRAGGDVLIGGTCESVRIEAGGDISIKGGVIGHTPPTQAVKNEDSPTPDDTAAQAVDTAHLVARGHIRVRHIENAFVRAEKSILVDESTLNCDLMAIESIVLGKDGKTGRLMGGVARATEEVVCGQLGAPGATQTRVIVGINPLFQHRLDEMKQKLMAQLKEHSSLSKLAKFLKSQPDKAEILEKAKITLRKVTTEVSETLAEERAFNAQMQWVDHAQITIHQRVLDGTRVMIGKRAHYVGEEMGPGVFQIQEEHEGLVYAPLAQRRSRNTEQESAAPPVPSAPA